MRRNIFNGLLVLALVLPLVSAAALFQKDNDGYIHPRNELIRENVYVVAPSVVMGGPVQGDAFLGGGSVLVSGSISEDIAAVGGTVTIASRVQEDVRVAGGTVIVDDRIGGDLIAVGGTINVTPNATVVGDAVLLGGQVVVNGLINQDVDVMGGEVTINGTVAGDIMIRADEKIVIGESAIINGDLEYASRNDIVIKDGASVRGEVIKKESAWAHKKEGRNAVTYTIVGIATSMILIKIATLFVAYLILVGISRKFVMHVVKDAQKKFWQQFAIGIATAIVVPLLAIGLCVTLIGIPFGALLGAGYVFMLVLSTLLVGPVLGLTLLKLMKQGEGELDWKAALLGIVVFVFLRFVPIIGWAVDCVFVLLTFGVLAHMWYQHIWKNR